MGSRWPGFTLSSPTLKFPLLLRVFPILLLLNLNTLFQLSCLTLTKVIHHWIVTIIIAPSTDSRSCSSKSAVTVVHWAQLFLMRSCDKLEKTVFISIVTYSKSQWRNIINVRACVDFPEFHKSILHWIIYRYCKMKWNTIHRTIIKPQPPPPPPVYT